MNLFSLTSGKKVLFQVTSKLWSSQVVFPSLEWFLHIKLLISTQLNTVLEGLFCTSWTFSISTALSSPVLCTLSTLISWDSQFKEPIGVPSLYHILESLSRLWTQVIIGFTLFVSHFSETAVLHFLMSDVLKNSICETVLLFYVRGPSALCYSVCQK